MVKKTRSSNPVFSAKERRNVDWGARRLKLGSDAVLPFDSCELCVTRVTDPVVCREGHLFCRACVVENLLTQRQSIRAELARFDAAQETAAAEVQASMRQDAIGASRREELISKLGSSQAAAAPMPPPASMSSSSSATPAPGLEVVETPTSVLIGAGSREQPEGRLDVRVQRTVRPAVSQAVEVQSKDMTTCFWLPSQLPERERAAPVARPDKHTRCPCPSEPGKPAHVLRLKHLRAVVFTPAGSSSSAEDRAVVCPSCRKTLSNSTQIMIATKCGHALCGTCGKLAKQDKACPTCSASCAPRHGVVKLQSGGTGFAASRGREVKSESAPAFRCG